MTLKGATIKALCWGLEEGERVRPPNFSEDIYDTEGQNEANAIEAPERLCLFVGLNEAE